MNNNITLAHDLTWTPEAATWWRLHSYGWDAEKVEALMKAAQAAAVADDRRVVCRGDLEAAAAQVMG